MSAKDKKICWVALFVLIIKLGLLPFAQNTDSDAASRTWLGMLWLQHPIWITHSVWGPFHFYITGVALAIWDNPIYAPVVLNIILSVLMLFPFYFFVKREFNSDGAFPATCLLAVSPVIFRNSMMNMSEPPYLFLLALTLNFLSRGFHRNRKSDFMLAGMFATIGAGIRFEFWLFILIFALIVFFKSGKTNALFFSVTGFLYPLIVVVSNFMPENYSMKGFFNSYPWSLHVNQAPQFVDYLRRIWFYPLCLLVSLGPFSFIAARELIKTRIKHPSVLWCAIVFLIFLLITEGNAFLGTILLHERFVSTVALLSMPFAAPWFKEPTITKKRIAVLFCSLTVGLSYIYNISNITPLPRLADQTGDKVSKLVNSSLVPGSGLIVDFWEWENTYYIALQTKLGLNDLFVQEGNMLDTLRQRSINSVIDRHKQGVILLVRNSMLWKDSEITDSTLRFKFNGHLLSTKPVFNNDEISLCSYRYN